MDISTIERTVLEKCAKDAGWEIDSNAPADCINLFSSFFKETACIKKAFRRGICSVFLQKDRSRLF